MECKKINLEIIDSTNDYAKAHIQEFDPNAITLITADEQSKGRGRFNRPWYSPKNKNIYATYCFRLEKQTKHLSALSHLLSLSFCVVLKDLGFSPYIKWPNDIYLNGKKAAGVLSEVFFHQDYVGCILGIGINVNMNIDDLANIDTKATSLHLESGSFFDREKLTEELTKSFIIHLETFKKEGFYPFHNEFECLLLYKGQEVTVETDGRIIKGILHSTTVEGTLNIYLEDNEIVNITSGTLRKT